MTLPLAAIPAAIAAIHAALPDWTPTALDPYMARDHRDYGWYTPGHVVRVSVWDNASTAAVTITYIVGGAQVAHLVLTSADQVWPWLLLVGAVQPSQAELAAALVVAS